MPPKRQNSPHKRHRRTKSLDNPSSYQKRIMTGGATSGESKTTDDVCTADINRLLIGNPPVTYSSGQSKSWSKMASEVRGAGATFKKQFTGKFASSPGPPPALPEGCSIL